tara:strand:- start:38 stop:655 length:618 start_codon:yes stop_codon:yes gene_type:complete
LESTWIFDLDNTLHDAERKIFPVINQKINSYISGALNIPHSEADNLRKKYWSQYGATLEGLIKHHGINPTEFLEATHTIINFNELIVPMIDSAKVLSSISGRKIIYTNAPRKYTERVLKICQIGDYFDGIFTIEDSNFIAKPNKESMKFFLAKYKIKKAYFVDDVKENLEIANQFGISTIWLTKKSESPSYIDRKIYELKDLLTN